MESVEIEQKFIVPPSFTIPEDWVLATRGKQLRHYFSTDYGHIKTQYEYKEYVNTENNAKHALTMTRKWREAIPVKENNRVVSLPLIVDNEEIVYILPQFNYSDPTSYTLENASADLELYVDSYLLACGATCQSKESWDTKGYMIGEGEYWAEIQINPGLGKVIKIQSTLDEDSTVDNKQIMLNNIQSYGKSLGLLTQIADNQYWEDYWEGSIPNEDPWILAKK